MIDMKASETMNAHGNLFAVGDQDFETKVLKSDLPVVVDFWGQWCPHCRALAPTYQKLSEEYTGRLRFATMDTDEHQMVPARLGIQGLPTLIVFNGGKVISSIIGPHPTRLKRALDNILAECAAV